MREIIRGRNQRAHIVYVKVVSSSKYTVIIKPQISHHMCLSYTIVRVTLLYITSLIAGVCLWNNSIHLCPSSRYLHYTEIELMYVADTCNDRRGYLS